MTTTRAAATFRSPLRCRRALAAKMNARSFDAPSPLMSPLTIGVYGVPDISRVTVVSSTLCDSA